MKINLRLPIAMFVVVAFVCNAVASAAPAELHIGISPFLKEGQRQAITRLLPDMVVNPSRLPDGTRVVVWDAWSLVIIADFVIPTLKFDSAQARAPQLAKPLALVGQWMRTPAHAEVGVPIDSGAIKAPEWLYEASTNSSSLARSFVLLGSPIYRSPAEPAFDMGGSDDERYPSDGHLALSMRASVFGCAEKPGRLAHATVHWAFFDPVANEGYKYALTRWWTLFVQERQGGTLATFSADLPATLARALQLGLPPVLRAEIDPLDAKPVMRAAHPRSLPAWLEQAPAQPAPPQPVPTAAPAQPSVVPATVVITPEPAPEPVVIAPPPPPVAVIVQPTREVPRVSLPVTFDSTKVGIGIAWSAKGVDLDLYVRAMPRAVELYYNKARSKEGFLYNDERNANAGRYYEFVEFNMPVDLSQATVWVNYYSGSAANVTGQVVFFDHGRIKIGTFTLRANRGNRGSDSSPRERSAFWTEVRLADLIETAAPLAATKPGEK